MTIQTTNIDAEDGADGVDLTQGDDIDFTVAAGVIVQSEENQGIYADGTAQFNIANYGNIIASGDGVQIAYSQDQFVNERGASVSGEFGVYLGASSQTVINYGDISSNYAGIYDQSGDNSITNYGTVTAYGATHLGVDCRDGDHFANYGTISANDSGDVAIEASIQSASDTVKINNKGTVEGDKDSVSAFGSGSLTFSNTGDLDGAVALTNTGGDTFVNRGKIEGGVTLGNGSNTFDGRGGTIAGGSILGGTGTDTIYLGNDGETVNGGAGHDTIYGGSGADVFAFGSFAAANSDTIFGFNVSNDLIQLNHGVFTKLAVGAAPTFSVGGSASSPTDYLFYNATNGDLFYDPDGNRSGTPHLVAQLDPGLSLTAHNFKVV